MKFLSRTVAFSLTPVGHDSEASGNVLGAVPPSRADALACGELDVVNVEADDLGDPQPLPPSSTEATVGRGVGVSLSERSERCFDTPRRVQQSRLLDPGLRQDSTDESAYNRACIGPRFLRLQPSGLVVGCSRPLMSRDVDWWWEAGSAVGSLAAAVVGGWAAFQARSAAAEANAAARTLAEIERDRRHAELCPRLEVSWEPLHPGGKEYLLLRVALLGPPGLDRLDRLTVRIRDDHPHHGEGTPRMGGPTRDQIKAQIWGPYQFMPGAGPDGAQADITGRVTPYEKVLPVGEELPFDLQRTAPPSWVNRSSQNWRRDRGTVLRITFDAQHTKHGSWTLPVKIDVGDGTGKVTVGTGNPD